MKRSLFSRFFGLCSVIILSSIVLLGIMLVTLSAQYFREENWEFLKAHKFDFVSLDCTNGPLDSNAYYGHMGFDTNVPTRERMLKEGMADENTVFVCHHFSHNGHMMHEEMEALMNPKGFLISYDGMVLHGK